MCVCMCGFCNVWVCVCMGFVICDIFVGFVMFGHSYVWFLQCVCVCVCMCGFCNVRVCVCVWVS